MGKTNMPKYSNPAAKKQAAQDIATECKLSGDLIYWNRQADVLRLVQFYRNNNHLIVSIS